MDRQALIKKFEDEVRQARKNFIEGKSIPLEEFDWGLPPRISEAKSEYRVDAEVWTKVRLDLDVSTQIDLIYSYITNHLVNEPAAYKLKQTIELKFSTISTFPNSGTSLSLIAADISEACSNLQRIIAKKYVIIYEYYEEVDVVLITHVFHQTQDYGKIFQK